MSVSIYDLSDEFYGFSPHSVLGVLQDFTEIGQAAHLETEEIPESWADEFRRFMRGDHVLIVTDDEGYEIEHKPADLDQAISSYSSDAGTILVDEDGSVFRVGMDLQTATGEVRAAYCLPA